MERIDKILKHDLFIRYLAMNEEAEKERKFCGHTMTHFLDVARIAMILNLEQRLEIPQDIVYATALLHDIGRHVQYENGKPHEIASAKLAPKILKECGFDDKETDVIISAILTHRDKIEAEKLNLNKILYQADKWSRPCFACKAKKDCNWKDGKKNNSIVF